MPINPLHAEFMARALEQSRRALPACRPNPPVGCVIARGDVILTTGYTNPPGQHHAEAMALAALTPEQSATPFNVYVTLEPCSFFGRTPSCALTLLKYPLNAVYVSLLDPDPRNSGTGIEILRNAGVHVEVGLLEDQVRPFLGQYLLGG
jgi:pyrimidine deaminase RibD-like protein